MWCLCGGGGNKIVDEISNSGITTPRAAQRRPSRVHSHVDEISNSGITTPRAVQRRSSRVHSHVDAKKVFEDYCRHLSFIGDIMMFFQANTRTQPDAKWVPRTLRCQYNGFVDGQINHGPLAVPNADTFGFTVGHVCGLLSSCDVDEHMWNSAIRLICSSLVDQEVDDEISWGDLERLRLLIRVLTLHERHLLLEATVMYAGARCVDFITGSLAEYTRGELSTSALVAMLCRALDRQPPHVDLHSYQRFLVTMITKIKEKGVDAAAKVEIMVHAFSSGLVANIDMVKNLCGCAITNVCSDPSLLQERMTDVGLSKFNVFIDGIDYVALYKKELVGPKRNVVPREVALARAVSGCCR